MGARPQFIKASALSRAIADRFQGSLRETLLHTGQHYDSNMSTDFFEEIDIPAPGYHLGIGSAPIGEQLGGMIDGILRVIGEVEPDIILVYGDTTSTLAGALAASYSKIPLAHVEAGMRSFDRAMPEEINRVLTDRLSTYLFAPTERAVHNLAEEGMEGHPREPNSAHPAVHNVGDIMFDVFRRFSEMDNSIDDLGKKAGFNPGRFALCTIHRALNTDDEDRLLALLENVELLAEHADCDIVFPVHPRTKVALDKLEKENRLPELKRIVRVSPLGFKPMVALEEKAICILTDSGGVQKEAAFHGTPCLILRKETEWYELIERDFAALCDIDKRLLIREFDRLTENPAGKARHLYGDGDAAGKICEILLNAHR